MDKQQFQQLTEQQQRDFLKKIVEDRHINPKEDLHLSCFKHIEQFNNTALSISWEEPIGMFDKIDCDYYQKHFGNLVESVSFNVMIYVKANDEPALIVNYYLYC